MQIVEKMSQEIYMRLDGIYFLFIEEEGKRKRKRERERERERERMLRNIEKRVYPISKDD